MKATHTITQAHVGLSARRPIRQHPYRFYDGQEIQPHDHEYYEIVLVTAGEGMHVTPEGETRVGPGSLAVLAPGEVHGFSEPHGLRITNVYYLAAWLLGDLPVLWRVNGLVPVFLSAALFDRPMSRTIPQCTLDAASFAGVQRELEDIEAAYARGAPQILYLRAAFIKALVLMAQAFALEAPAGQSAFRREIRLTLEHAERCIAQCEPFRVTEAANAAGVSPDHLSRVFREATGRSPQGYYQNRRVQQAGRLLLEPDRDITEIAHSLGFCDAAHFCKVFKRYQGASPTQYRALYAGD